MTSRSRSPASCVIFEFLPCAGQLYLSLFAVLLTNSAAGASEARRAPLSRCRVVCPARQEPAADHSATFFSRAASAAVKFFVL
jgi:hypothetical protein